jgi:hypothetical protein
VYASEPHRPQRYSINPSKTDLIFETKKAGMNQGEEQVTDKMMTTMGVAAADIFGESKVDLSVNEAG